MAQFVCDFLPYRRSNAYYRTLHALRPEDWSGTALTNKSDSAGRFVEIAAGGTSGWLPVNNSLAGELWVEVMLRPASSAYGVYGTFSASALGALIEARIDVAAGLLRLYWGGVQQTTTALPASVWTNASNYSDAWLRIRWDVSASPYKVFAKVWSVNEPEPAGFTDSFSKTGIMPAVVSDPNAIGNAGIATVSACRYFGYSNAWNPSSPQYMLDRGYFDKWFKRAATQGAPRVLAAEIFIPGWDGASVTAYTTAVLRVASQGYDSGAAWPFSNQVFAEGLIGWPTFSRKLPDDIYGRQEFTIGDLMIANPNGIRDDWLRANMVNAFISLRYGDPSWPWYDLRPLFTGTVADVAEDVGVIRLKLRDAAGRFDRAVHRSTLTTSNANNGKPTPISAGRVFNVSPVQTDATTLTYRIGEANIIALTEVRDRGVPLTVFAVTLIGFDAATEAAQTAGPHTLAVNDPVTLSGRLPSPLAAGLYYVQAVPAPDKLTFSATVGGAVINLTQGDAGNTAVVVWPSANTIRATTRHGRVANDIVRAVPLLGALTGGLSEGVDYYVIASGLTANELKLSLTLGGSAVTLAGNVQVLYAAHQVSGELDFELVHGLAVNDVIRFTGAVPVNVNTGTDYYVRSVPSAYKITFSATLGGAAFAFLGSGVSAGTVSSVNTGTGVITLINGSPYTVGEQIDFENTPPAPLVAGQAYWVKTKPATNDITVSATPSGAAITLTSTTTGATVRRYSVGGNTEKPVPAFRLTSYAGAATVDQVTPNLAAGTFKLRQNPAGTVTCDFDGQQFNGASAVTGYHAIGVLIGQRDPMVTVESNDLFTLNKTMSFWRDEAANLMDEFDLIARSVGGIWFCTRHGAVYFFTVSSAFNYTPSLTILADDQAADKDGKPLGPLLMSSKKLPVGYNDSVRVAYKRNCTVQGDSDLAGSVTPANRTLYGTEYTTKVMNAGYSPVASLDDGTKGELRKVPLIETCLIDDSDANWVGQSNLIDSTKQLAYCAVTLMWTALDQFPLGVPQTVKIARYGIDPAVGQPMVVLGVEEDLATHTARLLLAVELSGYYPVTP